MVRDSDADKGASIPPPHLVYVAVIVPAKLICPHTGTLDVLKIPGVEQEATNEALKRSAEEVVQVLAKLVHSLRFVACIPTDDDTERSEATYHATWWRVVVRTTGRELEKIPPWVGEKMHNFFHSMDPGSIEQFDGVTRPERCSWKPCANFSI